MEHLWSIQRQYFIELFFYILITDTPAESHFYLFCVIRLNNLCSCSYSEILSWKNLYTTLQACFSSHLIQNPLHLLIRYGAIRYGAYHMMHIIWPIWYNTCGLDHIFSLTLNFFGKLGFDVCFKNDDFRILVEFSL